MPVSAVLADDEIMMTIKPGEHGVHMVAIRLHAKLQSLLYRY